MILFSDGFKPQNFLISFFFLFAMKLSYLLILGYFNTTVGEYKVIYPDGTTDYVTKDDFDGANCYSYKVCCYKKRSVQ